MRRVDTSVCSVVRRAGSTTWDILHVAMAPQYEVTVCSGLDKLGVTVLLSIDIETI